MKLKTALALALLLAVTAALFTTGVVLLVQSLHALAEAGVQAATTL